jgi:hypothetical protein
LIGNFIFYTLLAILAIGASSEISEVKNRPKKRAPLSKRYWRNRAKAYRAAAPASGKISQQRPLDFK